MLFKIVKVVADVLLPLWAGYLCRQHGWMSEKQCQKLMLFNVIVLLTTMNLMSFWILPVDSALLLIPVLSLLTALLAGSLAAFTFAKQFSDLLEQGSYVISCMLSNIGTMAGLAAYFLFGEVSYAYTQLFAVPQNILMVIFAFPLAQYYRKRYLQEKSNTELHLSFRKMFLTPKQLGLVGMLVGIALHLAQVARPEVITQTFSYLVHVRAWIALLPVGFVLDFHRARLYYKRVLSMLPLRFLLVPGIIYCVAKLFFSDQVLLGTILVAAAAPVAINAVITATLYQLNLDLPVAAFIVTTASYVVIAVPALYLYLALGGTL